MVMAKVALTISQYDHKGGRVMKKSFLLSFSFVVVLLCVCVPMWCKKNFQDMENFKHWITVKIFPDYLTLGFNGLCKWYDHNGCFIFKKDANIALKSKRRFGYGIRPIGKIIGYEKDEKTGENFYIVEMENDAGGDFFEHVKTGYVPEGVQRKKEIQRHFKWNIEHHFKLIS